MAKNLKLNIKNTQIAQAINLGGIKDKLAKKKAEEGAAKKAPPPKPPAKALKPEAEELPKEEAPAAPRKARSKSAFAEPPLEAVVPAETPVEYETPSVEESPDIWVPEEKAKVKTSAELRQEIFGDIETIQETYTPPPVIEPIKPHPPKPFPPKMREEQKKAPPPPFTDRLGPTGRHIKDFVKPKPVPQAPRRPPGPSAPPEAQFIEESAKERGKIRPIKTKEEIATEEAAKGAKTAKFKEFRDFKPARRTETKQFDARDRQGLRSSDEDQQWRKKRGKAPKPQQQEDLTIRPTSLKVRLPITIKDLAAEMKLKASELISKLFLQGVVVTLNDRLEDETTLQLLGHEFGCEIAIDTAEEKRIQITDKTIKEELQQTDPGQLQLRPLSLPSWGMSTTARPV